MPTESLGRILFTFVVLHSLGYALAQSPTQVPPENHTDKRAASVLSVIPGDALVAVTLQDLQTLDARIAGLSKAFGEPLHPLMLAKLALGIAAGIDDRGSAAVVLVPVKGDGPVAEGLVLILPASSRAELLTFFDPKDVGGGVTEVTIRGRPSFAASRSGYTIFGSKLETVKSVVSSGRPLVAQCSDEQLALIAGHDVTVYVNAVALGRSALGKRFAVRLGPEIGFAGLFESIGSFLIATRAESGGVSVSLLMEDRLPRQGESRPGTSKTLLRGLPDEPFAFAAGGLFGADDPRVGTLSDALVSAAVAAGIVRVEQADNLRAAFRLVVGRSAQGAASVSLLPGGEHGTIGAAKIIATQGPPERWLRAIKSLVELLKGDVFADERYARVVELLEWKGRAEVRGGVEIDRLRLALDGLGGIDQEKVTAAFGGEGFLIRLGAVDGKYVVVSLGGGVDRFDRIVATLRAGRAPLSSDVAVQMSRIAVSQERFWEAYLSVDRWLGIWGRLRAIVGGENQWGNMPQVNAPVAVAVHHVGKSATQIDLFVPVELLVALKTAMSSTVAQTAGVEPTVAKPTAVEPTVVGATKVDGIVETP